MPIGRHASQAEGMAHSATLATRAVHAGREGLTDIGVHAVPLDLSTTFPARDSAAEAARLDVFATGEQPPGHPIYGRVANPTMQRFEAALAELEGCEAAVAFATGMAALSACLLAAVAAGRPHVVAVRPLYGTSDHLLDSGLLGTQVSWVSSAGQVGAALRGDTGLVVLETPANPTLTEIDLRILAAACGEVPLLVDNTFATPVLQQPAEHGARLILHSATKFLGGHGDVMGGIVACARTPPAPCARSATPPAPSCTRWPATCCCAAWPPCRYASAPPPQQQPSSPTGSPAIHGSAPCTTPPAARTVRPHRWTAVAR